ncbi:MAG: preprotein translocase subunit SecA [Rhodobacterales bacterium]|nr:preprotein translocase subunit SecA [Rhodobacterales bacterium]
MFETFTKLAKTIFGDANERELKKLQPLVDKVNALEAEYEKLSDEQIGQKTQEFRERLKKDETLDDILPEAFASVREAAKRTLGMRHYDCQLIGGIVLHQGKIAEMKTGEGKTLVGTLPTYLNAIEGKGAHLVTVNDYLAKRDAEWMEPVYKFLGLTVGTILSGERNDELKRAAYGADVTYGTNNEFGFDYLRDNMKFDSAQMVQRPHNFAIIDEVDSILIDEARTPLIISGPMDANIALYGIIDAIIPLLQNDVDFIVDEKGKSASLTDEGISKVESKLGIDNLYDPHNMEVLHHLSQLLKAHYTFKRDRDYVVREGEVVIVDEFTGRLMAGRRWSDGLHQAVEAKEKVRVQKESQVYATITFQNLFRMYDKLAGMTGTADTEAAEFADIYDLETMIIPTNMPIARLDEEDVIYKTQMEKFRAVVADIKIRHANGQPVLVGTTSVERSEIVHKLLERAGIPHEVLNAKNHSREALIVAQAGRLGSVTISTNMAGRGTDIKLGGNPEHMAEAEISPLVDPEGFAALHARYIVQCAAEEKDVLAAGGLCIIGTERHESRRVDNQLRGRAGRQGDAGGSRFYLSLEDDLMRIFGSDKITVWMERMGLEDDEPIEHRWISSAVQNAQIKVEGHHFNSRKNLLEYDDVMNYQRKGVYAIRRRALNAEGIVEMLEAAVENVVKDIVDDYMSDGVHPEHWNLEGVRANLKRVFDVEWPEDDEALRDHSLVALQRRMLADGMGQITAVKDNVGEETFIEFGRMLVLQFTDSLWKDHLLALDRLRQGVGLRGYGQRNPLLEYKREAFHMYQMMSAMRDEQVLRRLLAVDKAQVEAAKPKPRPTALAANGLSAAPKTLAQVLGGGMPAVTAAAAAEEPPSRPLARPPKGDETRVFAEQYGVKRNDPCPCGSEMKFKKCCYKAEVVPPV